MCLIQSTRKVSSRERPRKLLKTNSSARDIRPPETSVSGLTMLSGFHFEFWTRVEVWTGQQHPPTLRHLVHPVHLHPFFPRTALLIRSHRCRQLLQYRGQLNLRQRKNLLLQPASPSEVPTTISTSLVEFNDGIIRSWPVEAPLRQSSVSFQKAQNRSVTL